MMIRLASLVSAHTEQQVIKHTSCCNAGPKGAEGGEGGAEKGGSPKRPARELDVWPPPPPPDRSQLPLAKLPRVSLPEPPVPPQPKVLASLSCL